jgi:NAD-dependent deacetylase
MTVVGASSADLERAAAALRDARSVQFITRAGLSADSGLPTYRGIGGLYEANDPEEDLPIETLLSGAMMARRPELTWKYLAEIARACRGATFNRGHEVIAEVEQRIERTWTLTQNVDGLHRAAGSTQLIEIHGTLHARRCTSCRWRASVPDPVPETIPPRCPDCDAIVRPDVVLFNELLPEPAMEALLRELDRGFDLVFSVGTSSAFPYIVEPVLQAAAAGRTTIEINPVPTILSPHVSLRFTGGAATTLDAIWRRASAAP